MSELDDALKQVDAESTLQRRFEEQHRATAAARRERFVALVEDFLSRMNDAGNPGTFQHGDTRAWSIGYDPTAEKPKTILLTVDGRMPFSEMTGRKRRFGGTKYELVSGYRSFRDVERTWSDTDLSGLAKGMARLLRR